MAGSYGKLKLIVPSGTISQLKTKTQSKDKSLHIWNLDLNI